MTGQWDGVPPGEHAGRTGYHWVSYKTGGKPWPLLWTDEDHPGDFGWQTDDDELQEPGSVARWAVYHGPVAPPPTPSSAAALAEQCRALEAVLGEGWMAEFLGGATRHRAHASVLLYRHQRLEHRFNDTTPDAAFAAAHAWARARPAPGEPIQF